jgi:hypothetical protein
MVFLDLLEITLALLIFVFFLFQVVIPIWSNTVLFPTFRTKARELEKEIRKARFNVELEETRKQLKELQEKKND